MGKDDIKNTLTLTKIKLGISSSKMLKESVIILFVYLAILLPNLVTVLKYKDTVVEIRIFDYSIYFFIGIVISSIVMNIIYKYSNDSLSVFPQTNTSRFLSSQIVMYAWLLLMSVISLVCYLLQILIFKSLSTVNSSIILVFDIDYGFTLLGFFVFLMYGLLALTFISFIAALIRKFDTVAVIVLLIILALLLTGKADVYKSITDWLGFLTNEKSNGVFFLKAFIIWCLLLVFSLILRKFTVYYRTKMKYRNTIVAVIGTAAIIVVCIIRFSFISDNEPLTFVEAGPPRMLDSVWMDRTITLDTSAYEDLSSIRIETNIKESDNIHISKALPAVKKDKIIVQYRLPVRITNDYNLIEVTNPKFSATLEDSTLSIQYNYDKNVKVLFISPWFMMRQFERYQDKNLYSDSPDFYYSNSYSNGYVNIFSQ